MSTARRRWRAAVRVDVEILLWGSRDKQRVHRSVQAPRLHFHGTVAPHVPVKRSRESSTDSNGLVILYCCLALLSERGRSNELQANRLEF